MRAEITHLRVLAMLITDERALAEIHAMVEELERRIKDLADRHDQA